MDSQDSDPVRSSILNQVQYLHLQEQQLLLFKQEFASMLEQQKGMLSVVSAQLHCLTTQFTTNSPPQHIAVAVTAPLLQLARRSLVIQVTAAPF